LRAEGALLRRELEERWVLLIDGRYKRASIYRLQSRKNPTKYSLTRCL
jgi:hypothetical protein